jgi:hypothetical protein
MKLNRAFFLVSMVAFLLIYSQVDNRVGVAGEESEEKIGPRVEVVDEIYDFGKVFRGETVHHTFTMRNSGDDHLQIKGIQKDCGCLMARNEKEYLVPGEEMPVSVSLDTKMLDAGELEKTVRISTNDMGEPETVLTITGEVLVTANFEPARIILDGYKPGDPVPEQIVRWFGRIPGRHKHQF